MRVVVTGAGNPHGAAIVDALVAKEHSIRLFGCTAEEAARWGDKVQWHAGHLSTVGSIEPVLAEREVLIHAACLDAEPGKKQHEAFAARIERSTLGCRYGAERELLDQFIHVAPADAKGPFRENQARAVQIAEATRKVPVHVVRAASPDATAQEVLRLLDADPHFGRYPGRESDAVAA